MAEGYCYCGCNRKTTLYKSSIPSRGQVAGEPRRYMTGHHSRVRVSDNCAQPFKIDGVYCRLLPLTQGLHAIVDADDWYWIINRKWWARKHTNGYCAVTAYYPTPGYRVTVKLHNEVLKRDSYVIEDGLEGDHANCCGLDNRSKNLRPANRKQQTWNRRKSKANTSGYKGVSRYIPGTELWLSRLGVNGIRMTLGVFVDPVAAARAHDRAAIKHYGEFANLNFPLSYYLEESYNPADDSTQRKDAQRSDSGAEREAAHREGQGS